MRLDDVQLQHFRLAFSLEFERQRGKAFERLFSRILSHACPGDFVPVEPYGRNGDMKCDGFQRSTGTVFQCYAPERLSEREAIGKIERDLAGAVDHWSGRMRRWIFVHPKADGLPAKVLKRIEVLQDAQPDIRIETWSFAELLPIVMDLSLAALSDLFGAPPVNSAPRALDLKDLRGLSPDATNQHSPAGDNAGIDGQSLSTSIARNLASLNTGAQDFQSETRSDLLGIHAKLDRLLAVQSQPRLPDEDDARDHAELDRIRILLNEDKPSAALTMIAVKERELTNDASDAVRSRLKALAGHCRWQLGQTEEAELLFREAASLAPTERRGIAAGVLAEVVKGDFPTALRLATDAMQKDPRNDAVVPWLLMAAARVPDSPDPSELVAAEEQDKIGFCEGYIDFLRAPAKTGRGGGSSRGQRRRFTQRAWCSPWRSQMPSWMSSSRKRTIVARAKYRRIGVSGWKRRQPSTWII